MKCSSRLLCGLLMSCLCFRGSYEELTVIQSPSSITVNEGQSDQISCCWNKTKEENYDFKVAWYKDNERIPVEKRLNQTSPMKNCSFLKIINIGKNDTGDYVCKVIQDIPVLLEYEGQKTYLNVSKGEHRTEATTQSSASTSSYKTQSNGTTGPPSTPILPLSLGLAAAIGLLTLCLAFSVCKMRNSCKKSERVVIHQTPHSEGEEHENMEEEEGSTGSSRGSLQWVSQIRPHEQSKYLVQDGKIVCAESCKNKYDPNLSVSIRPYHVCNSNYLFN
ncbi:uncharacterized protein LOC109072443 isoform X2 [Cyprinus carpio]|uniref:Uncharacterized protein LOC109072443 isoform X2 n=1 Tax=Cyprinus carpio TaxID=7962 RepID=A0A9Q9XMG2_CYPCA|nr:uncharacterized protein LOC109072443 isoform X2 [Cyprinus carpio]